MIATSHAEAMARAPSKCLRHNWYGSVGMHCPLCQEERDPPIRRTDILEWFTALIAIRAIPKTVPHTKQHLPLKQEKSMAKDLEPQPPKFISIGEAEYNGRKFFGDGMGCNGHADTRAELTYLRDWQAWAQRQLKSLTAHWNSVNEALNSGDGVYRP